jgi:hypothetical protein
LLASFIYLALRKLIELALLGPRSRRFKELEIVVLRHELANPAPVNPRLTHRGSGHLP